MARDDRPRLYRTPAGTFTADPALAGQTDALERFRAKCQFDPRTGCVLWTGGTTRGRGNTATYGSFWYEGRRWFAHRWSGVFIHGLDIEGLQVGHDCKFTADGHPNTLCVEHVTGETQADNLAEQLARLGPPCTRTSRFKADQTAEQRRHWLFTEIGLYEPEPVHNPSVPTPDWPDFTPPDWLGLLREEPTP
jgi:hypothetical protein